MPPQKPASRPAHRSLFSQAILAFALAATAVGVQARPQPISQEPIRASLGMKLGDSELLSGPQAPTELHTWLRDDQSVPLRDRLVSATLAELGVPYAWGGNNPDEGFDCSGLVRFVYANIAAIELPRRARQQRPIGEPVKRQNLQPGDLVFFNTMRDPASHVGIYIGDDEFVHAPSGGAQVRVDKLSNSYWSKRYTGARRYLGRDEAPLV